MIHIPGYEVCQFMDSNEELDFYKGKSIVENKEVIIAVAKSPEIEEIVYKKNTGMRIISDCVLLPVYSGKSENFSFIIYNNVPFQYTLSSLLRGRSLTIDETLFITVKLSSIMAEYHQKRLLYGSLNPNQILISLQEKKVYILGNHNDLNKERVRNLRKLSNYIYSSPEFTGRMGIEADYRSDLYSLGVLLYEMLSFQLPFQQENILENLHAHFTKLPEPPSRVNPEIPEQLSRITLRLLEKTPENRYQTALALKMDLEKCAFQLEVEGEISTFPIGENDISTLNNKMKLFGRDKELSILASNYEMVREGGKVLTLISGNSGSGKTALVNDFKRSLAKDQVLFIEGKWDQFDRNIPYAPIIQAFKSIFRSIVAEGEENIKKWKSRFLKKLGNRCQLLLDFIPEFKWVIGEQEFNDKIGALERHNSILIAFHQFLLTVTDEIPVVMFIDDIQWADRPSIDFLRYIAMDTEITELFIILTSRNEMEKGSKSSSNLELIREFNLENIVLQPLQKKEIEEWLLHSYLFIQDVGPLASYVYNLSQGNPFITQQILITLEKEDFITTNLETGMNEFYIGRFPELLIGKDVVQHISQKIEILPEEVRKNLGLASCLGSIFTITEMSISVGTPQEILIEELHTLIDEGFICFSRQQIFKNEIVLEFIHDKVHQAVYTGLKEDERNFFHFLIGMRLREEYRGDLKGDLLYKVTDHLNLSGSLLDIKQRDMLAFLNAKAGEAAKNAAAFEAAYSYFAMGKELLNEDSWRTEYDLTFQIYSGLGECAYLNSDFQVAEEAFETLMNKAKTNEERITVYNLKLILYTHQRRLQEAVNSGIKGLSLYGWKLNRPIGYLSILKEIVLIQLFIIGKKPNELLNLPSMTSMEHKLVIESMINMNSPTYHIDQKLATYLMLRAFRYTLKHGDTDLTALVYNNYSLILSAGFGNFDKSYQFGKLARDHVEKSNINKLKGRVYFVFGSFVNHWKNHIKGNLESLVQAQKLSLENGNFHLAGASSSFIIVTRLIKGDRLTDVLSEIDNQLALVNKIQYSLSINFIEEMKAWLEWLLDSKKTVLSHLFDDHEDPSAFIMHNTVRLQMYYIMNDENRAKQIIHTLNQKVTKTLVLVIAPEFYFYHTLWLCRLYPNTSELEQRKMLIWLKRNVKNMKKWSKHSPLNYRHKYLLMKAETDKVLNRKKRGESIYEEALENALKNGYYQDAALISECAAIHYCNRGLLSISENYFKETYRLYEKWGAIRKLELLTNMYPEIFKGKNQRELPNERLNEIDLEALIKATRALSSEILLETLTKKVLEAVIEHAGATSGILFLVEGEELTVANSYIYEKEVEKPDKIIGQYPTRLIQYVQKSEETLILHHASNEGLFKKEPYIQENNVLSIMAIPLLHQGTQIGILYLENNMLTHAFTEKEILLTSTIASQAAISIQNAQLYMQLEEKVKRRTVELENVNNSLEKANQELEKAEKTRMELLSNISHDLRNPITSIQGYIEAMLDGIVISPEKQILYLQRSKEKLTSLNRLIEDLFELSKLQYGNMTFVKEIVSVEKVFNYLCKQHEWDIRKHGLDFRRHLPKPARNLYPLVEVDVGRIEQVFANIIANALRHTVEGKIVITLHMKYNEVIFEIADTGKGIPSDEIEKIFERSYTGKTNSSSNGNGLGLSISKEIILHHKGDIWAESILGKGTSIFFTIPILNVENTLLAEMEEQGI